MAAAWQVDTLLSSSATSKESSSAPFLGSLSTSNSTGTSLSLSTSHSLLWTIRAAFLHRPWTVLQHGVRLLKGYSSSSEEYWETAADMCRAACDCGQVTTARRIADRICGQFGSNGVRVRVLSGQLLESQGKSSQAMDLYIHTISEQPLAPLAYKRQIALLKQDSKWNEAVALLNHYLSIYGDDLEAWAEMCALALRLARFAHALFAASELVAQDSTNYAFHLLLADVYMTCGQTRENTSRAHQHYVASANARGRANLRAVYGIWFTASLLLVDGDEEEEEEQQKSVDQQREQQKQQPRRRRRQSNRNNNNNNSNNDNNDSSSGADDAKRRQLIKTQAHAKKAIEAIYQSAACAHVEHGYVTTMLENYPNRTTT